MGGWYIKLYKLDIVCTFVLIMLDVGFDGGCLLLILLVGWLWILPLQDPVMGKTLFEEVVVASKS